MKEEKKQGQVAVNKLILLYFIEKAGIPVSNTQITQFAIEYNYMDYFVVQNALNELLKAGYLEKTAQHNKMLYYISDEGTEVLTFFLHMLPDDARSNITGYLGSNRKRMKMELDVSANYFPMPNGEYLIKCALLEGTGELMMEIDLTAGTKEQAIVICKNWKNNTSRYYQMITAALSQYDKNDDAPV